MADFKYEIVEELGVLSESAKSWTKEIIVFLGMVEHLS